MKRLVMLLAAIVIPLRTGASDSSDTKFHPVETLRVIISAQAYYQKVNPDIGYACDFQTLMKARALSEKVQWTQPLDGYVYTIECVVKQTPQATFRATAVPTAGGKAFCTDETTRIRSAEGGAPACFAAGR